MVAGGAGSDDAGASEGTSGTVGGATCELSGGPDASGAAGPEGESGVVLSLTASPFVRDAEHSVPRLAESVDGAMGRARSPGRAPAAPLGWCGSVHQPRERHHVH